MSRPHKTRGAVILLAVIVLALVVAMPAGLGRLVADLWVTTMSVVMTLIARLFGG